MSKKSSKRRAAMKTNAERSVNTAVMETNIEHSVNTASMEVNNTPQTTDDEVVYDTRDVLSSTSSETTTSPEAFMRCVSMSQDNNYNIFIPESMKQFEQRHNYFNQQNQMNIQQQQQNQYVNDVNNVLYIIETNLGMLNTAVTMTDPTVQIIGQLDQASMIYLFITKKNDEVVSIDIPIIIDINNMIGITKEPNGMLNISKLNDKIVEYLMILKGSVLRSCNNTNQQQQSDTLSCKCKDCNPDSTSQQPKEATPITYAMVESNNKPNVDIDYNTLYGIVNVVFKKCINALNSIDDKRYSGTFSITKDDDQNPSSITLTLIDNEKTLSSRNNKLSITESVKQIITYVTADGTKSIDKTLIEDYIKMKVMELVNFFDNDKDEVNHPTVTMTSSSSDEKVSVAYQLVDTNTEEDKESAAANTTPITNQNNLPVVIEPECVTTSDTYDNDIYYDASPIAPEDERDVKKVIELIKEDIDDEFVKQVTCISRHSVFRFIDSYISTFKDMYYYQIANFYFRDPITKTPLYSLKPLRTQEEINDFIKRIGSTEEYRKFIKWRANNPICSAYRTYWDY